MVIRQINKKGQLKIQQMAFMLIAITLFFVLVGLFVLSWSMGGLKNKATALESEKAMQLLSKIANSPEFSCGEAFSYGKISCVDEDKVMVLKGIKDYGELWGVASIQVRKIYPEGEKECTLKNYPDCNIIEIYSKGQSSNVIQSNFVSLCRKENKDGVKYDKCELAIILVSYIQKGE